MTTYNFYDAEHDRLLRRVERTWKAFTTAQETSPREGFINMRRDIYKAVVQELFSFYEEHGRPT